MSFVEFDGVTVGDWKGQRDVLLRYLINSNLADAVKRKDAMKMQSDAICKQRVREDGEPEPGTVEVALDDRVHVFSGESVGGVAGLKQHVEEAQSQMWKKEKVRALFRMAR
ncbi:uncharacterized protein MONOS_18015 [Monocercomonoides exilis]|uniref:uncharacterized protein n=1 Tax=Monocercomonoides exilis TaxID=2049356 RepID=UPI003559827B|nr:hypothetical protein MONOS_18015 [Monocercomonoides exilis]